jgi:hypothetical protein
MSNRQSHKHLRQTFFAILPGILTISRMFAQNRAIVLNTHRFFISFNRFGRQRFTEKRGDMQKFVSSVSL